MKFLEYLQKHYSPNEPIFVKEIKKEKYSPNYAKQMLKKLYDEGHLKRFDTGVYYIPTETVLGTSVLSPRKVIEKKFISNNGLVYGFYTGYTLANSVGLTTQVPNELEIMTNYESSRGRTAKIGKQVVHLKKSRVEVTQNNVDVLKLLELLNMMSEEQLKNNGGVVLRRYLQEHQISRSDINKYIDFYPLSVSKGLIKSGVIYELIQG